MWDWGGERGKCGSWGWGGGGALLDVLETNVQALGNQTVSDLLVDDDTDSARGHVPHAARAAVVELVGHTWMRGLRVGGRGGRGRWGTFVDCAVCYNVDGVAELE